MSIGVEKNSIQNASDASGLIRSVTLVETVCSYQNHDQLIPVSVTATDYVNKEIVLRTIGSFGTYTWRLAHELTINAIDLLTNGQSILLKLEQKDGFGNAVLVLKDSRANVLETKQLAPSGTYLITRTAETIGVGAGYNIVCINDGSSQAFNVASGVTGRQVGYGIYEVTGTGAILIPQILIPAISTSDTQTVVLLVNGGICQIETIGTSLMIDSFGSAITFNLSTGAHIFKYYNSKIYKV